MSAVARTPHESGRPWRRALVWLFFLAPFFYLTYGAANWLASVRDGVPSLAFAWERAIPFLPWTIIPYWSINAFYGLSLFLCRDREELDTHGRRLLTAQVAAVLCFVAAPLRFSFERPEAGGLPGLLFDALAGFDKPFNQAPSLHIALLVILWALYAKHVSARWRWLLHGWFALIGISVLTTFQHHFFDIPTGTALGFLCLWVWPERAPSPLGGFMPTVDPKARRLALRYLLGSAALALAAIGGGGAFLWLLWPALSLLLVASAYGGLGAAAFQKRADGRMSAAALALFLPYLLGAWINSRLWTWRRPEPVPVAEGVWLSRFPSARVAGRYAAVVDCSAELPRGFRHPHWRSFPMLDLLPPTPEERRRAAAVIAEAQAGGSVLVCCALGYSRSAAALGEWLVSSGRAPDFAAALARIRDARPAIVVEEPVIHTTALPQ